MSTDKVIKSSFEYRQIEIINHGTLYEISEK